jgi:hypothetical protein
VLGINTNGDAFALGQPPEKLITPSTVQIQVIPLPAVLVPRTQARFLVQLVNYGAADIFNISSLTQPQAVLFSDPPPIALAPSEAATSEFIFTVPDNIQPLAFFEFTVTATGTRTAAKNKASLSLELTTDIGQPLLVSVKPGSCDGPIQTKSKGVTPVAIIATAEFDPLTIDPKSIYIAGSVSPVRIDRQDVGSAEGQCGTTTLDGRADLVLHFSTQDLVAAIANTQFVTQRKAVGVSIPLSARTTNGSRAFGFGQARLQE